MRETGHGGEGGPAVPPTTYAESVRTALSLLAIGTTPQSSDDRELVAAQKEAAAFLRRHFAALNAFYK